MFINAHHSVPGKLPRTRNQRIAFYAMIAGLIILIVALSGCQSAPAPTPTEPEATPTPAPTAVPTVDPAPFIAAWETSKHSNTYDLGKGPNTYCSRCHSPLNWDPEAKPDTPPNCVTCKFPMEPNMRIAETMDFVEEEDWKNIGCEMCHPTENGVTQPEIAWLNPITHEYEPALTSNELCSKCHATPSGGAGSAGGMGVDHAIVLGGSAHLNWAGALPQGHRPSYCTDCHDPHSSKPKTCVDCHENLLNSPEHAKAQDDKHANVSCMACHDSSGMETAPDEYQDGLWVTVISPAGGGQDGFKLPVKSHSIQTAVSCDRCHSANNIFGLSALDANGQPAK